MKCNITVTLLTDVECAEGKVRLVGGVTNSSGRLEVCANRVWGRVCNALRYWGPDNARVVCRQLGFSEEGKNYLTYFSDKLCGVITCFLHLLSVGASVLPTDIFGAGNSHFRVGEIHCTGTETELLECSHNSIGEHLCHDTSADVAVWCYGMLLSSPMQNSIGAKITANKYQH